MTYKPSWNSLIEHATPKWLREAKFGIYTHWGPYSVHACGSNTTWYSYNMYYDGSDQFKHHLNHFGHPKEFGYKDFIPLFKAESFNADEWVDLFKKAGAKFVGPVGEHHDGFTMWDTKLSAWNSVTMGPKRDVVGELEKACRGQGLKYMVALHHAENWWFFPHWIKGCDVADPRYEELYGELHDLDADFTSSTPWDMQQRPSKAFLDKWLGKTKEVIDKYRPDMLWFDFGIGFIDENYKKEFLAYYYNMAEERGQEVAVAYKDHSLAPGSGLVDLELGRFHDLSYAEWLTDTTIDDGTAWGYMEGASYKSAESLVHYLVDNVSKNGYLLLNVGPKPDGTIPEEAKKTLLDIGRWLAVNGEAIYGTTPWLVYGEGPTKSTKVEAFNESEKLVYTAQDFRFTSKDDTLYAICMNWPEGKAIIDTCKCLYPQEIISVEMLGHYGMLNWKLTGKGLEVETPKEKPCESAYVFRITRKRPT